MRINPRQQRRAMLNPLNGREYPVWDPPRCFQTHLCPVCGERFAEPEMIDKHWLYAKKGDAEHRIGNPDFLEDCIPPGRFSTWEKTYGLVDIYGTLKLIGVWRVKTKTPKSTAAASSTTAA